MEESEIENIEAVPEIEIEPVEPEEQGSPSMIRCSDIWRRSGNILSQPRGGKAACRQIQRGGRSPGGDGIDSLPSPIGRLHCDGV